LMMPIDQIPAAVRARLEPIIRGFSA